MAKKMVMAVKACETSAVKMPKIAPVKAGESAPTMKAPAMKTSETTRTVKASTAMKPASAAMKPASAAMKPASAVAASPLCDSIRQRSE
jgi:hypothetical protein